MPAALRQTHLKPGRDFAHLGRLCHEVSSARMPCRVPLALHSMRAACCLYLAAPTRRAHRIRFPFPHSTRCLSQVGWKHFDLIQRLETARKAASEAAYKKKKEAVKRIAQAKKALAA